MKKSQFVNPTMCLALGCLFAAPATAQDFEVGELDAGSASVAEGEIVPEAAGEAGAAVHDELLLVKDEAPPAGTPVVAARLYPVDQRVHLGASYEMSVIDKYVEHQGVGVNIGYHLDELLQLRFHGGYFMGSARQLLRVAEDKGGSNNECKPAGDAEQYRNCLPDTNTMSWIVGGELIVEPFYGKVNFVSEMALNFDIYLGVGGGALGRGGLTADYNTSPMKMVSDGDRAGVALYATGLAGVRIWLARNLEFTLEAREIFWKAERPYLELNQPSGETDDYINTWTMAFGLGYLL